MLEEMQPNSSSEWSDLTWAEQTYYLAKYGYTGTGALITDSSKMLGQFAVPGSNDRLQRILEDSRENVASHRSSNSLIHTGPDGSIIITNEGGWVLPRSEQPDIYADLDEQNLCHWGISQATWVPEAPYWAICSDY